MPSRVKGLPVCLCRVTIEDQAQHEGQRPGCGEDYGADDCPLPPLVVTVAHQPSVKQEDGYLGASSAKEKAEFGQPGYLGYVLKELHWYVPEMTTNVVP